MSHVELVFLRVARNVKNASRLKASQFNYTFIAMKKNNLTETINGVASTASTECANQQQWTKYHSKQGHGFAAEDANALWDRLHGKTVDKVGLDNSLNGPDRISNGVMIQTKYHADASKSVASAFSGFINSPLFSICFIKCSFTNYFQLV